MNKKVLIVLPCRIGSTRLPEKHLIELSNGKTIFEMTYEVCIKSKADKVIIATDDKKIFTRAKKFTQDVIMTSSTHKTGSDRVAEIAGQYLDYEFVVNIQGDEPLINVNTINDIINGIINSDETIAMCTAVTKFNSIDEVINPNNIKVIMDKNKHALYFSRSVVPFDRNSSLKGSEIKLENYKKHLGLYAYKRDFLAQYTLMNQTFAEKIESLEQLRILENGYKIKIIETTSDSIGIDTKEDMENLDKIVKKINLRDIGQEHL